MGSRQRRVVASALLVVSLVAISGPNAIAVEALPVEEVPESVLPVRTEPAEALAFADLTVSRPWLVITDELGDIVSEAGTPISRAEPPFELEEAWITRTRVSRKMLKSIEGGGLKADKRGNWRGSKLNLKRGDDVLVVALKTRKKANPKRAGDAQIMVLFDGPDGVPAQVGPGAGIYTGFETVSMGGGFPGGGWLSGDSLLSEHVPGADVELFNTRSRGVGTIDKEAGVLVHISPIPDGAESVTAALRLDSGGMYDVLTLPGGGTHIGLEAGLWTVHLEDASPAPPPYVCQRTEVMAAPPAADGDGAASPAGQILRLTYGVESLAGVAAVDTVPLELQPLPPSGSPLTVEADVERFEGTSSVRVSAPVPPGRWLPRRPQVFAAEASTVGFGPDRQDATIGSSGILVEVGQNGHIAGDARCGAWEVDESACADFPTDVIAASMGLGTELITGDQFADGVVLCFAIDEASQQTAFVAGLGIDSITPMTLEAEAAGHACPASEASLGAVGVLLDCGADGFVSYQWVLMPAVASAAGASDGLRASLDINLEAVVGGGLDRQTVVDALAGWSERQASMVMAASRPLADDASALVAAP